MRRRRSASGRGRNWVTLSERPATDDARGRCDGSFTLLEYILVVASWHDKVAAHLIIDVRALHLRLVIGSLASPETIVGGTNLHHPFVTLFVFARTRVRIGIDEPTNRVTIASSTMRIELSSLVACFNVDLGEISCTSDLNISTRLDKVNRAEGTCRNKSSSMILRTPSYFVLLTVCNGGIGIGWSPKTKVLGRIDDYRLTHRSVIVALGTDVGSLLTIFARLGKTGVAECV